MLIFPKVYQTCLTQLVPDTVVRIRGRITNKDESIEMQANELTVPEVRMSADGPVTIQMPVVRCIPPVIQDLRQVLTAHPGGTEVRVKLLGPDKSMLMRLSDSLRVSNEQPLIADLKALLGPRCIAV